MLKFQNIGRSSFRRSKFWPIPKISKFSKTKDVKFKNLSHHFEFSEETFFQVFFRIII